MLKEHIIKVFSELETHKEEMSKYLIMIHEPIAAVLYSIEQLKKAGVSLKYVKGDNSRIVIMDLGGGTCDFSLVDARPNDISKSDITLNDAVFAGGFYVDQVFMQFLGLMFPESLPAFRNEALNTFMEKKKNYPFQQFEIDFPEDFDVDLDDFKNHFDSIFAEIFNDDEIEDMHKTRQIHVTSPLFIVCFNEAVQQLKSKAKEFLLRCAEKGPIDHIICVGGLTESDYVYGELNKEIKGTYNAIKQKFKFTNDIEINKIGQRSLAIIIGGKMLFQ